MVDFSTWNYAVSHAHENEIYSHANIKVNRFRLQIIAQTMAMVLKTQTLTLLTSLGDNFHLHWR